MMKLCVIIISVLLSLSPCLLKAQAFYAEHDITKAEFAPSVPKVGGLLWEISGKGLKQKSYLLATYHGGTVNFTMEQVFKIPGLHRILENIDAIGMEYDVNKYIESMKKNRLKNHTTLTIGTPNVKPSEITQMPVNKFYSSLFKNYGEWKAFDSRMRNQGVFSASGQKPAYWLIVLKQKSKRILMPLSNIVNKPCISVDDLILQYSKKNEIERFYLDTWRDSLQLDNIQSTEYILTSNDTTMLGKPLKVQLNALLAYLDTLESKTYINEKKKELERIQLINDSIRNVYNVLSDSLLISYMSMNLDKIGQVDSLMWIKFGSSGHIMPTDIKPGTIIRNEWWIPIIKEQISKVSCLIAIGCRHMPGKNGIIDRLRKEGYVVTPLYE